MKTRGAAGILQSERRRRKLRRHRGGGESVAQRRLPWSEADGLIGNETERGAEEDERFFIQY